MALSLLIIAPLQNLAVSGPFLRQELEGRDSRYASITRKEH